MKPEEFRALRLRLGLEQTELADSLGCSASQISQIERGIKGDTVPKLYSLALFGLSCSIQQVKSVG
ncbi:helix-turn-helix domain-containing protein [Paenirhodobacter populi]|nr:helix-turn-helix transcriptional regulator [Sinirhodobacter populi]